MILRRIWHELMTPSTGTPGAFYVAGVIAMAHALLGAPLFVPVSAVLTGLPAALIVGAGYFLLKEIGDLRRGGSFWDGAEDAVMVSLGAWYGAGWWPLLVLFCGFYVMVARLWRTA